MSGLSHHFCLISEDAMATQTFEAGVKEELSERDVESWRLICARIWGVV